MSKKSRDVGIYDADVDKSPEEVLPPLAASAPHPIVGEQLIESVDTAHVFVVASNTDRHRQVDQLAVPSRTSHGVFACIIRGNDEHVPLMPCDYDDEGGTECRHSHDVGGSI